MRDLLYRFRPAGAPGAAGAAGVPVDRGADLAAELEPLFDLLAGTEQACAESIVRAERDAAAVRARAAEGAREVLRLARSQADAARIDAAEQAVREGAARHVDALAAARRDAAALRVRAAARTPSYVALVTTSVAALLGDQTPVDHPAARAR